MCGFLVRMMFRHELGGDFDLHAHANDVYRAVNVTSITGSNMAARGGAAAAGLGHSKEPVEKFQKRMNRVKLKVDRLNRVFFFVGMKFILFDD